MGGIALLAGVSAVFIMIDVPRLRRAGMKRELIAFWVLLVAGFGLGAAQSLRVRLPNPLDLISIVFRPLSDMMKGVLT